MPWPVRRPRACASATRTRSSTSSRRSSPPRSRQFGGAPLTRPNPGGTGEARREVVAWQEWERPVGVLGAGSDALGGWTLDVHHSYDPQSHTLHTGDGTTVTAEAIRSEIRTVLGKAPSSPWDGDTPATRVTLGLVRGGDAGADGSVYAADARDGRVYRVKPGGGLQVVAGGAGGGDGSATAAPPSRPRC